MPQETPWAKYAKNLSRNHDSSSKPILEALQHGKQRIYEMETEIYLKDQKKQ